MLARRLRRAGRSTGWGPQEDMGTAALLREAVQEPDKKANQSAPASGERQQPDPRQRRKWRNLFRYSSGQVDPEIHSDDEANKAPVTRGSLKRFFEFVKPHKGLVLALERALS